MTEQRIDKWLWAMRIFKTRTAATDSCRCGRVSVGPSADNAVAVKPSRPIKPGDTVHVRRPPVTYSFVVKALSDRRLGAKLVADYMENVTPRSQLELLDAVRISGFIDRRKGLGRPTKRDGRQLSQFTSQVFDDFDDGFGFDEFDFDDSGDDIS